MQPLAAIRVEFQTAIGVPYVRCKTPEFSRPRVDSFGNCSVKCRAARAELGNFTSVSARYCRWKGARSGDPHTTRGWRLTVFSSFQTAIARAVERGVTLPQLRVEFHNYFWPLLLSLWERLGEGGLQAGLGKSRKQTPRFIAKGLAFSGSLPSTLDHLETNA